MPVADESFARTLQRACGVIACSALLFVRGSDAQTAGQSWLDAPIDRKPFAGSSLPAGSVSPTARAAVLTRCMLVEPTTPAARAVSAAGWVAFLPFDRVIARGDVEVVGGMRTATESCSPAAYNLFVFVGGDYAGALSPIEMTTGKDGVAGFVRVLPNDVITVEFARYRPSDTECCPYGRVRVSYVVDRREPQPVVVPTEAKVLRE